MRNNAIAIANYFIDKSNSIPDNKYPLTLLRLVKYVYIAYGFALAILNKKIIDERFDKVEAWKYGPVIPSVYHSFKNNRDNKITDTSLILREEPEGKFEFLTPRVEDEEIKKVLDFVWERYEDMPTTDLIQLLHRRGTPWEYCYRYGQNVEIPDQMTKLYYEKIIENALK